MDMRYIFSRINNNKGATLIIALTVVVIATIITLPLVAQAISERQMSDMRADYMKVFYAAESGINDAMIAANVYSGDLEWLAANWTGSASTSCTLSSNTLNYPQASSDIVTYTVTIQNPTGVNPSIVSTGTDAVSGANRSLSVSLEKADAAILAKGGIEIKGNATINGDILEYADFMFDNVFGDSLANVRGDTEDTEIVDTPANNYDPVPAPEDTYTDTNINGSWDTGEPLISDWNSDGEWDDEVDITWYEWDGNNDYLNPPTTSITTNGWTGSEVLVVYGGNLKITGGTFNGLIYVKSKEISVIIDGESVTLHVGGDLQIAGNAVINGAIFVDGSVEGVTGISGTPEINYDPDQVPIETFDNDDPMPFVKQALTWQQLD